MYLNGSYPLTLPPLQLQVDLRRLRVESRNSLIHKAVVGAGVSSAPDGRHFFTQARPMAKESQAVV